MQVVTDFSTERPKDQRIYVVARDPDTGKSKSVTVYGIDPETFVETIKALGEGKPVESPDAASSMTAKWPRPSLACHRTLPHIDPRHAVES